MILNRPGQRLRFAEIPVPEPKLPLIPGHENVGTISALGQNVTGFKVGERVGIPWLGWTCCECGFCRSERENLCERAAFTGYTLDGGYAEYTVADARFCFPIPDSHEDAGADTSFWRWRRKCR